ncbi:hypothetical protein GCM10010967_36980 [Dyadobacter beijingensis]|uniref:Uncharacterized protein n=1 Tax=Dyadobacter beijingensis TaxID=365489 RepID=A0ABQ2I4V4_9BACT|nr:hypothetical protein [Dyadobacter beijingensis]GGM99610.1 hypothetical protein GCM10010967_36980 [Dyadobacter beijingensis]
METKRFTGREGRLISVSEAQELTHPHQKKERDFTARGENYVKAEFFGIHTFNELIKLHGENCVGFRVYYGLRDEEEDDDSKTEKSKKPTPRLVLVPVDEDGKDIMRAAAGGLKDMPVQGGAMTGGPLCPRQC